MIKLNCFLFCLLAVQVLLSQIVETVVSHPRIVDGIHVNGQGDIFTTPGGLMGGLSIGKVTPAGDFDPNFSSGFNGAIDIDENAGGLLFVTNYDDNSFKSYDPTADEVNTLVTGLDGPAGLTLDNEGNIFLTCFGAPPSYNGNQIVKVSSTGSSEVWLETTDFFRPQGITFDDDGNLWVANTPTGKIFKIDTTTKIPVLILELGAKVGNLVFRQKDQKLYFASQQHHRIYRMDLQGNLDTLAGSGNDGPVDGTAMTAQFNKPLGLGFTVSEDTLYVAESGKLRRIIEIDEVTSLAKESPVKYKIQILPNPSTGSVTIDFPDDLIQWPIKVSIIDEKGRIVFEKKILVGENAITLNNLGSGIRYVRVFFEKEMVVKKLIAF